MLEESESHEDEIARHEQDDAEEKAVYGEHGDSDYESGELESEGDPEVYSGDDDDDEGEWGAGDESVMSPVFSESEEESGDEVDVKSDYTLRNSGVQDYGFGIEILISNEMKAGRSGTTKVQDNVSIGSADIGDGFSLRMPESTCCWWRCW
jgi:hypothetical protein